jgi:hypothetical protein
LGKACHLVLPSGSHNYSLSYMAERPLPAPGTPAAITVEC